MWPGSVCATQTLYLVKLTGLTLSSCCCAVVNAYNRRWHLEWFCESISCANLTQHGTHEQNFEWVLESSASLLKINDMASQGQGQDTSQGQKGNQVLTCAGVLSIVSPCTTITCKKKNRRCTPSVTQHQWYLWRQLSIAGQQLPRVAVHNNKQQNCKNVKQCGQFKQTVVHDALDTAHVQVVGSSTATSMGH